MKLNQITIPSLDLSVSKAFYEQLGMQLIVDAMPDYIRFVIPEDQSSFSVHRVDSIVDGESIWIYFECDNLDQRVSELQSLGLKFDDQPEDKPWLWREARLRDPDGNRLILYRAGENRLNPPWRVQ